MGFFGFALTKPDRCLGPTGRLVHRFEEANVALPVSDEMDATRPSRGPRYLASWLACLVILAASLLVTTTAHAEEAWSVQEPPVPSGAGGLGGVSCTSSTACVAAGVFDNGSGYPVPLAESWNGTTWSAQEPPLPTGAKEAYLNSVSCTSSTACTSVGEFVSSPLAPLAESWNGTAWSAHEPPLPAGTSTGVLQGVSCISSTACVAVGDFLNIAGKYVPLAERWNGTTWSAQEPPLPASAKEAYLVGISCTSSTACTGVGYFLNASETELPLAERWNGTTWSAQTPPTPTGAKRGALGGVSCTSSTACTATGGFLDSSELEVPLAESWNGTTWSAHEPPLPAGVKEGYLAGVSCTSSTACMATGQFLNSSVYWVPLAEHWNGTSWTAQEPPTPAETIRGNLDGVSCTSSTACMAAGGFESESSNGGLPLAERYN